MLDFFFASSTTTFQSGTPARQLLAMSCRASGDGPEPGSFGPIALFFCDGKGMEYGKVGTVNIECTPSVDPAHMSADL